MDKLLQRLSIQSSLEPEDYDLLIEHKVLVLNTNWVGDKSALMKAAEENNYEEVKILLKAGANPRSKSTDGIEATALMLAAANGHNETVKILISETPNYFPGYGINQESKLGYTALMYAAANYRDKTMKILVKAGANTDAVVVDFAQNNVTEIVQMLFKAGANKRSALYKAVMNGKKKAFKLLLQLGANIDARDKWSHTLLMDAAGRGRIGALKILLDAGAKLEARDKWGNTALMKAARRGRTESVKILLDAGAKLEARDNDGKTVLMWAALKGNNESLKILLNAGAKLEAKDNDGTTALMYAAKDGDTITVKILLNAGAKLEAKDNNGNTALMYAAKDGSNLKILLESGADTEVKNKKGLIALNFLWEGWMWYETRIIDEEWKVVEDAWDQEDMQLLMGDMEDVFDTMKLLLQYGNSVPENILKHVEKNLYSYDGITLKFANLIKTFSDVRSKKGEYTEYKRRVDTDNKINDIDADLNIRACPICCGNFAYLVQICDQKHCVCSKCLDGLLKSKAECIYCRTPITRRHLRARRASECKGLGNIGVGDLNKILKRKSPRQKKSSEQKDNNQRGRKSPKTTKRKAPSSNNNSRRRKSPRK